MNLLNKLAILSATDCRIETVDVPEWGGAVRIRAMTGAERDAFRTTISDGASNEVGRFEAALLALTLVDENGNRLFELAELDALRAKSATVLDRVAKEAMRINGMDADSQDAAAKN